MGTVRWILELPYWVDQFQRYETLKQNVQKRDRYTFDDTYRQLTIDLFILSIHLSIIDRYQPLTTSCNCAKKNVVTDITINIWNPPSNLLEIGNGESVF